MEGFSPVAPPGTLCATAARRRNQQRNGARVRKLTPIPQAKPGSRYRPVRVIEAEVMASVSEEDEEQFAELAQVRWSPASPSPQRYQHYYDGSPNVGLAPSRKVQYCRSPEVHEYTKESSGSYVGARFGCKIHADGAFVNLVPEQAAGLLATRASEVAKAANAAMMAAGTRAPANAFDAVVRSPPRESNIITVLEQTKGGQQQQVLQVIEDCSCFDQEQKPEPAPQPQVQTSPCRECLDEMLHYRQDYNRAMSNASGAKSPAEIRVMQEAALYETNDDRIRSVQVKQERIHAIVPEEVRTSPKPRSIESNHGAVAEPAIRIIHEERLIDPNAPPVTQEQSAVRVQTPKEVISGTVAAAQGATGKDEPIREAVMDPSVVPVKSLSDVHIIQDFPKFDVPASVRIIHSTASANKPSSVRLGQDVIPKAIPVPYEPLHVLKEERRFEAVNLIKGDQRSDSRQQVSKQEHKSDHGSESPTQGNVSRPSSGRELGRQLSHSHIHETWSNNSRALVPYEEKINDDDRRGPKRPGREPGRISRGHSPELAYRARSYERPWDQPQPTTIHIQSRRRPAGLHINLEQPEPAPLTSPDRMRREKSALDKLRDRKASERQVISKSPLPFNPQLRPPELPPINTRSAPMDEVARHAWKQYSLEYQRYLSNLAEWNQQQQILKSQLGNLESDSTETGSEVGQSLVSQKTDMEEEPMHVRITLSGNSLRRGRSGTAPGPSMSPMGSPRDRLGKHTVCSESISLIETVEPPDPPRCSSHIEANRQRKARAAEEAELEASFEERPDRRVHMTPLCTEHMSYRAFSSNSPRTKSSPRAPSPRGAPMSRLVPVLPITKHYMERIDFPDNPEPLRRQMPRKIRRHLVYPVFPQLQMGIPKDFLVYFLVSMATLAGIFAAVGVFSKHERSLTERVTQNAPVAMPLLNGSHSLFTGRNRRTVPMNLDVCKNTDCQREGRYLASHLSWNVEPCADFYAFVCTRPGPAPLRVLERNAAHELRRKPPNNEIMPLKQLHDRCMKREGRNWDQLHDALALLSLDGWPFHDSQNLSHDLIWEIAATLERRIGVSSLLSVSVQPRSKVLVLIKTKTWPQSKDKLMEAHFTKYAEVLRPDSDNIKERATEVLNFARELDSLPDNQPDKRSLSKASPYRHFISLLGLGKNSDKREVLFSEELASQLNQKVNDVAPHVALNYQGFMVAEKMSPLLPDASPSEETCWRLVQDALPELFLYAVYRTKSSVLKQFANVTENIRNNVISYVNSASWMEATVRRRAVERLRELRVLAFVPGWFSDTERVRAEFAGLPHPSTDSGPLAYIALKEHTNGRRLHGKAWPVPPHSSQCAFDDTRHTVYVPLLATNLTKVQSAPLVMARLPRLGVQLAACLMHAVTSEATQWWGERSLRKLEPLRKCVYSQSTAAEPSTRGVLLDHMAALAPAHSVYSSHLRGGGTQNHEYRLEHAENITSDQLFFIHFATAKCHGPAQLVNVPLKNYEPFRRAFNCHPGARMSPAKTCRFWTS